MQVRVFESADMASGLKKIKQELGPNALILSTRTVRNGKLGILGKPMLEITAAVDTDFPQPKKDERMFTSKENEPSSYSTPVGKNKTGFRHVVDDSVEHYLNDERPSPVSSFSDSNSTAANAANAAKPSQEVKREERAALKTDDYGLHCEVNELKELVKNLAGQISKISDNETTKSKQTALQVKDTDFANRLTGNPIHGDHILSLLVGRGINVETSRTIAGFLRQSLTELELSDPENVTQTIIATIQDLIEVSPPVFASGQSQQRIALVGPTGVGKTTTLAKIAASYLSKHSNSIAMITIDTYRIAAVEQLKVYGEIMHLPVDVVITPEQLEQAITRHSDKELI
ncbi:MAG: flagellar biosynthesis protein FlhF, partial [Desulforhopalus sp.]